MFVKNYAMTILLLLLLTIVLFTVHFLLLHNRQILAARLEKQMLLAEQEKQLLISTVTERDHTLDNISRELHDHFSQLLRLMQMHLHMAGDHLHDMTGRQYLLEADKIAESLIQVIQDISRSLSSDFVTTNGLETMIRQDIEKLQHHILQVSFNVEGTTVKQAPRLELALYRIFQEAMTNVLRHAQASQLDVVLHYNADTITLKVSDDGRGFDYDPGANSYGLGLRSIRHRAEQSGGTCLIVSSIGRGCNIIVSVPCIPATTCASHS